MARYSFRLVKTSEKNFTMTADTFEDATELAKQWAKHELSSKDAYRLGEFTCKEKTTLQTVDKQTDKVSDIHTLILQGEL